MSDKNNLRVAVALTKCFYCGEGDKIVLNTRLTPGCAANVEKINGCVIDMDPCNKCKDFMQQGIILITIDNSKSGEGWNTPPSDESTVPGYVGRPSHWDRPKRSNWMPNPYRTGGFFVIREEAARRIFNDSDSALTHALKYRWIFIEHEAAERIGLFAQATKAQQ